MASPPPDALSVFIGLVLVLAFCGLTVSGHFPADARDPGLRTTIGKITLWATIAVALLGGGAMVLIAPQLLRPLPDRFVDGRRGLILCAAVGLALTLLADRCAA